MKEEALKLADYLKQTSELGWAGDLGNRLNECSDMIRKLVAELEWTKDQWNKDRICFEYVIEQQKKPLSNKEILEISDRPELCDDKGGLRSVIDFARAIEERILGR